MRCHERIVTACAALLLCGAAAGAAAQDRPAGLDEAVILRHLRNASVSRPGRIVAFRARKRAALEALEEAGPAVLAVFDEHKYKSRRGDRGISHDVFWEEIVTSWPKAEIGPILHARFREGIPAHQRIVAFESKPSDERENAPPGERAAVLVAERQYIEWFRVAGALKDISYTQAGEDIRKAYLIGGVQRRPDGILLWTLAEWDPEGTSALLMKMLESGDPKQAERIVNAASRTRNHMDDETARTAESALSKLDPAVMKKASSILAKLIVDDGKRSRWEYLIETICSSVLKPDRDFVRTMATHPEGRIRDSAMSRLGRFLELSDVDLLLGILEDPKARSKGDAQKALRRITYMNPWERVVTGRRVDPAPPWKEYWKDKGSYTEERFREESIARCVAQAKAGVDQSMLSALHKFGDDKRVYSILQKALESEDGRVRDLARRQLARRHARGESEAAPMLLAHCEILSMDEVAGAGEPLAMAGGPKAVPILVRWLEESLKGDGKYMDGLINAAGDLSDEAALDVLVRWAVEKRHERAFFAIANIKGAHAAAPRLADAMAREENREMRDRFRDLIMFTAEPSIAPKLTALLEKTTECAPMEGGPRADLLRLLERFPDPEAKPLLLEYLAGDDLWSRVYGARALAKMGDHSGEKVILADIGKDHPGYSQELCTTALPAALSAVGDDGCVDRLIAAYGKAEAMEKARMTNVLIGVEDERLRDFFLELVARNDPPGAAHRGFRGLRAIIKGTTGRTEVPPVAGLPDEIVLAVQSILASPYIDTWADTTRVVAVAPYPQWQFVVFDVKKKEFSSCESTRYRQTFPYAAYGLKEEECLQGNVVWHQKKDLMYLTVEFHDTRYSNVFRRKGDAWEPLTEILLKGD